jgi:chitin synthase
MMGTNRIKPAESSASLRSSFAHEQPRSASMAGMSQFGGGGSAYGGYPAPMPFGANPFMPGTAPSSEYGGPMAPMHAPNMLGMNPFAPAGSPMMSPYNPFGTGSIMNGSTQSVNPFANPQQHVASPLAKAPAQQPIPAEPATSYAAEPTDDELFRVVDWYVRSNWQDDSITRKKVRLAVFAKFPEADLVPRTQYINDLIDRAT